MNGGTFAAQQCGLLALLAILATLSSWSQGPVTSVELVQRFKGEKVFWKQKKIAKDLIAFHDPRVLSDLEPWLTNEDRHIRANVALVFAGLGDDRGFATLKTILSDFSDRPITPAMPTAKGGVPAQIVADRYYAVHIFGELKDRRAVPILTPLLKDESIGYAIPWALGEIGDRSAIPPLIEATHSANPDLRVTAIHGLAKLRAKEALPRLHEMLNDNEKIHFDGLIPVSEAAREAIVQLEATR